MVSVHNYEGHSATSHDNRIFRILFAYQLERYQCDDNTCQQKLTNDFPENSRVNDFVCKSELII